MIFADASGAVMFSQTMLTIVVAVIVSVLTLIATHFAQKRFFGPHIEVAYLAGEYGQVVTEEQEPGKLTFSGGLITGPPRNPVRYVRLRVRNKRGNAKGCRGFLTDVERRGPENKFTRVYFDAIPLCWSYLDAAGPQIIDLPKGVDAHLDFLSLHLQSDMGSMLRPRLWTVPFRYESIFESHGDYRLTVTVTAENADPVSRRLEVDWHGGWKDLEVRMLPNDYR
jgi:hypothetical protein